MQALPHEHPDVEEGSRLTVMTLIAGRFIETPEIEASHLVIGTAIILREIIEIPGKSRS